MQPYSFIIVRPKPLNRPSSWLENKYRLHVDVVETTINDINLLKGLLTTKAIICGLVAERLSDKYDKRNAPVIPKIACL
jgi:hypothetical protein